MIERTGLRADDWLEVFLMIMIEMTSQLEMNRKWTEHSKFEYFDKMRTRWRWWLIE
jgi:hypothetical protein